MTKLPVGKYVRDGPFDDWVDTAVAHECEKAIGKRRNDNMVDFKKFDPVNTPEMYSMRNLMRNRDELFDALESKVLEIRRLKTEAHAIATKFRSVDDVLCFIALNSDIDQTVQKDIIEWRYRLGYIGKGDDVHISPSDKTRSGYEPSEEISRIARSMGVLENPHVNKCIRCGAPLSIAERALSLAICDQAVCIDCLDQLQAGEKNG